MNDYEFLHQDEPIFARKVLTDFMALIPNEICGIKVEARAVGPVIAFAS